jgi:outer membrane protein TolC
VRRGLSRFGSIGLIVLLEISSLAQTQQQSVTAQVPPAPAQPALRLDIPHSDNPLNAYRASLVPQPNLANSSRIDALVKDGVLELSLKDAISLALENNLDIAIARYNLPIAAADVLRTQAGGSFRGVNTGVVQNTPGAGVGGFGSGTAGAGAGGTSSTLGAGTNVSSYDPAITGTFSIEHYAQPLSNTVVYGVPILLQNTTIGNIGYTQSFPTGTSISAILDNNRGTLNSPESFLNPTLNSYYHLQFQQQLLAGFGFGPNLRFLHIAKNNQRISDEAFKLQVVTTVTQIADMYWDLVAAYEDK